MKNKRFRKFDMPIPKSAGRGVGVDIEFVGRFRKMPFLEHKEFYKKIFTRSEIAYCLTYKDPYPYFAARFSAKEATIKALGGVIGLNRIEVTKNPRTGEPHIRITSQRATRCMVSLSHTKDYAIAFVVLEHTLCRKNA